MVVYAALLGGVAYGFYRLLPGQLLAIVTTASALWWGGVSLTVGLEWNEIRENETARGGVAGMWLLCGLMPLIFGIDDVLRGHERSIGRSIALNAAMAAFTLVSSLAGFGIGVLIARRRATREMLGDDCPEHMRRDRP
jgi:Na+/proline symporter